MHFLVLDLKRTLSWLFRIPACSQSFCVMSLLWYAKFLKIISTVFKWRRQIQIKKLSLLLLCFFHEVLQHLNTFIYTNFRFERVLRFAIENGWMTRHLPGGLESYYNCTRIWVKNDTDFWDFNLLSKYFLCLYKYSFNLCYKFLKRWIHLFEGKLNDRCFCWFYCGNICAPQRDTNMASLYKALKIWV